MVFGLNHDNVIVRGLAPYHAVHGQQTGSLIHWEPAVWSGFDMKVGDSCAFFVEKVDISGNMRAGI